MTPAGLTSHACYPSTAIDKSPIKVGTLDDAADTLGNLIHFASFLHPLCSCDLHLTDLFTVLLFLFGSFLRMIFFRLRLFVPAQMFNVYSTGDSGLMCHDAVNLPATTGCTAACHLVSTFPTPSGPPLSPFPGTRAVSTLDFPKFRCSP